MPRGAMPAAIAFFKAYKVYPSPEELLVIYQRTMPPEIFAIIMLVCFLTAASFFLLSFLILKLWMLPLLLTLTAR
jgi:hypothetical protein